MAEQIEIANAYVALTTKLPNVKKDIEQAIGGADVEKQGRSMGDKLMGGMKVTALAGAAVVGAGIVAGLGVALTKGFGRLTGIENATAKMSGLGFSAKETQGLMDNALESVKGTAFGLESAAGVAAQMAAAGIGPGEEMAGILSTVAGNAAAAGGTMEEMGSIFSKAATQANGVQNDVISQLADRGIPIYQALGEQLGVTAGDVFKLASDGKIGFSDFAAAAEAASGDVAAAMGETTTGSWNNFLASLGRGGAGLLGGVFGELAPTIQAITEAMGPMEDVAAEVGEAIGGFLAPAFEAFRDLLDSGFDFSMFGELLSYFSPLSLVFQALEPVLPLIADMLSDVFSIFGEALGSILPVLIPVLSEIVGVFAMFLAEILPPILPLIVQLAELIGDVLLAVTPLLEPLGELVAAIFPVLAAVISALMPIIEGVVDAFGTLLMPIVETLVDVLGGLITFLTGVFTGNWEMAWQGVVDIFEGLWNGLVGIAEGVVNAIIDIINGLTGGLNEFGNFLSDVTGGAIDFEIGQIGHVDFSGAKGDWAGSTPNTTAPSSSAFPVEGGSALRGAAGGGDAPSIIVNPAPGMDEEVIGQAAGARLGRELAIVG
ncbi:MAG: phage tail protein [Pseudoclavibacter sp.]